MDRMIQTNIIEVPFRTLRYEALCLRSMMENAVMVNIFTHNLGEFSSITEIVEHTREMFANYEAMICNYIKGQTTFGAQDWGNIKNMIFAFIKKVNEDTMIDYSHPFFS